MDPRVDLALRAQPPKDDEGLKNPARNATLCDWHKQFNFVILGRLSPKGEVDPRIHSVPSRPSAQRVRTGTRRDCDILRRGMGDRGVMAWILGSTSPSGLSRPRMTRA